MDDDEERERERERESFFDAMFNPFCTNFRDRMRSDREGCQGWACVFACFFLF